MSSTSARAKATRYVRVGRLFVFLAVLTSLVLVTLIAVPAAGGEPTGPSATGRYIIQFNDGVVPGAAASDVARQHGLSVIHVYSSALRGFAAVIPEGRLTALEKDPRIKSVEPDLVMSVAGQTLPTGVDRIDVDKSAAVTIDGVPDALGVTVAVIDTGIDLDHTDLNVDIGLSVSFDSRDPSRSPDDRYGHGTHVAGIIGAVDNDLGVVGVAPGVDLVSVRVLGSDGSGYLSDIIAGINYVTAHSASIDVANMSLGGTGYSSAYRTAIQNSVNAGVVYMVAAGNSGKDVYGRDGKFGTFDDFIPAAYPEVATISALADSDGKPGGLGASTNYGADDSFASFSNYSRSVVSGNPVTSTGTAIDLILPGVGIYSTYLNDGYGSMSGTSMASPHAAGLAALYIAEHGKPGNAAGVYAVRQALIDVGKAQDDQLYGLTTLNDKDPNWERLGWAGSAVAPPADITPPTVSWANPLDGSTVSGTVQIRIQATDDQTATGGLTVTWAVDGGLQQPASYEPSGYYVASWETAADGSYSLVATATDQAGNTAATAPIVVSVDNSRPPAVKTMHVSAIAMALKYAGKNVSAVATVTVLDANGAAVAGAIVTGHWESATNDTDTGMTDINGQVALESNKLKSPGSGTTYTFMVDKVELSGWEYDAAHSVTSNTIAVQ